MLVRLGDKQECLERSHLTITLTGSRSDTELVRWVKEVMYFDLVFHKFDSDFFISVLKDLEIV